MYLTYAEYIDYGGSDNILDEATFNRYCREASNLIDWYTFNRLEKYPEIPEKVKECTMHLVVLIQQKYKTLDMQNATNIGGVESNAPTGSITAQSNDGVSVSYAHMPLQHLLQGCKDEIKAAVTLFLSGVRDDLGRPILYRGLYPGE